MNNMINNNLVDIIIYQRKSVDWKNHHHIPFYQQQLWDHMHFFHHLLLSLSKYIRPEDAILIFHASRRTEKLLIDIWTLGRPECSGMRLGLSLFCPSLFS